MDTTFHKLNFGWNAEPNAPDPIVRVGTEVVTLTFLLNSFLFAEFFSDDVGVLTFFECRRYRLGATNDEGWYLGQCRFSKLAPAWGELYEIKGDLLLSYPNLTWNDICPPEVGDRHFLFYLRDSTFECTAKDWSFSVAKHGAAAYGHVA